MTSNFSSTQFSSQAFFSDNIHLYLAAFQLRFIQVLFLQYLSNNLDSMYATFVPKSHSLLTILYQRLLYVQVKKGKLNPQNCISLWEKVPGLATSRCDCSGGRSSQVRRQRRRIRRRCSRRDRRYTPGRSLLPPLRCQRPPRSRSRLQSGCRGLRHGRRFQHYMDLRWCATTC